MTQQLRKRRKRVRRKRWIERQKQAKKVTAKAVPKKKKAEAAKPA